MNFFICSTERPFQFIGVINEDVNTYASLQKKGTLFLTYPYLSVVQTTTQTNEGGLTDFYLDEGTYIKSFYSVIVAPDSVKISVMGQNHFRLHHNVIWNKTTPMIISEIYKKKKQNNIK